MSIDPEFGRRIRQLRIGAGMLQKELAARVGMQVEYLSKIESAKLQPPSESKIRAIAQILQSDSDELLLLAQRLPKDIPRAIQESPKVPQFLRTARGLKDNQWDQLIDLARRLAADGREEQ